MSLLFLLLACRSNTDPDTSVPTDPWPTSVETGADTSSTDTTAWGVTAVTGTTADTQVTAHTGHTGSETVVGTGGSTAHTGATGGAGGTAHTGAVDTAVTLLDTCPGTGHTGGPGITGDTASGCASAIPACVEAVVVPTLVVLYPDEVCLPVGDTGATGHTGTTAPSCPRFAWAVHITGPQDGGVGGITSLPDGDVIVVGNDERGMTIAPGRPDEVVLPEYGTVNTNAWMARIDLDGNVVWGRRLTFSTGNAAVTNVRALADGRVVAWGDVRDEEVTFMVGQPSQLVVPAGGERAFLAIVSADGELEALRFAFDLDTTGLNFNEVQVGPDGTIYASFDFDQQITVNLGEADETTFVEGRDQVRAYAAWGPDGSFRWLHQVPLDTGEGGRSLEQLVPGDGNVRAVYIAAGITQWNACTPFEHIVRPRVEEGTSADAIVQVTQTFDAVTGAPLSLPIVSTSAPPQSWSQDPVHAYGIEKLYIGVGERTVHALQQVPEGALMLYALDDAFQVVQPLTLGTMEPTVTATPVFATRVRANQDVVLTVDANGTVQAGGSLQWACGEPLDVAPYAPITSFDRRLTWQTFRPNDLQPLCGGDIGVGASGVEPVLDAQGGMVFAIGLSLPHTYGAGTLQERTIIPDITDAVILRYAP